MLLEKSHICEGGYEEYGARLHISVSFPITFTLKKKKKTALLFTLTDEYITEKLINVYYFMKKEKSIFVTEGYLLREVIL